MSKQGLQEDVQYLLESIAKESLELNDVDCKQLVEEWNGISQSLENTMKNLDKADTKESSEVEILIKENDGALRTNPDGENHKNMTEEIQGISGYNYDYINELEILEAEQPWNFVETESHLPFSLPDYQHEVHEKYLTEDGANVDIHETYKPNTWDDFENDICNGDKILLQQCRDYCLKLDEKSQLLASNIAVLRSIQEKQENLVNLYRENFHLLGEEIALEHVEVRLKQSCQISSYHQKIKEVLDSIRKNFPEEQKIDSSTATKTLGMIDTSEALFIETRPIPHFWKHE